MSFVNLYNHTVYMTAESAICVEDLVKRAAELGMPAVAVTDRDAMYALPSLQNACDRLRRETGTVVKPLFGCDLEIADDHSLEALEHHQSYRLVLLVKDKEGYRNLCYLSSARMGAVPGVECTESVLREHGAGLIALCSGFPRALYWPFPEGETAATTALVQRLSNIFDPGDLYLRLEDNGKDFGGGLTEQDACHIMQKIADDLGLKTVAANLSFLLYPEDSQTLYKRFEMKNGFPYRDLEEGDTFARYYFRDEDEMRALFSKFPGACDATLEIADKCDFSLSDLTDRDAHSPIPTAGASQRLRTLCEEGLKRRYGDSVPAAAVARLKYELGIIDSWGSATVFLVAKELLGWVKREEIFVTAGLAYSGGSLVNYVLGITEIDPLRFGLLPEPFLFPYDSETPYHAITIDRERIDEVIAHLREVYGHDNVIGTTGPGPVNIGMHIRGDTWLITPTVPYEMVPCQSDRHGQTISQYRFAALPSLGYQVLGIAGREEYSSVGGTLVNIERNGREPVSFRDIPLDDPEVFHELRNHTCSDELRSCFGLCGASILMQRMKPSSFSDVVAAMALRSPILWDIGIVGSYLSHRDGTPKRLSYGPVADAILEETYGIIVYKEQVIRILEEVGGFSPKEALRCQPLLYHRIISDRKPEQPGDDLEPIQIDWEDGHRESARARFLREAQKHECNLGIAGGNTIQMGPMLWMALMNYGGYASSKASAVECALLAVNHTWLRLYYPTEYLAALLTVYARDTKVFDVCVRQCERREVPLLVPDINESDSDFTPTRRGIRFGLAHIKGLDDKSARSIVEEREANGLFTSFEDYLKRMHGLARKKDAIRALVEGGAFDSLDRNRGGLIAKLEGRDPEGVAWNDAVKLLFEHGALGRYVSGELQFKHADNKDPVITAELVERAFDADDKDAQGQLGLCYLQNRYGELREMLYKRWDLRSPGKKTDAGAGNIMFKERMAEQDMKTIVHWAERWTEESDE